MATTSNQAPQPGRKRPRRQRSTAATVAVTIGKVVGTLLLIGIITAVILICFAARYIQTVIIPQAHVEANFVMDHRVAHVRQMCEYIVEHGSIRGSGLEKGVHGTYIVELASSIIRNENRTFIIITPNNGIIPNLPPEAMVEVPCLVNANGVTPLHMGNIPTFYKGLLENQYAYECLTVDALLNGDRDAALKALVLNRTVTDTGRAKGILEDLIRANRDYWQVK